MRVGVGVCAGGSGSGKRGKGMILIFVVVGFRIGYGWGGGGGFLERVVTGEIYALSLSHPHTYGIWGSRCGWGWRERAKPLLGFGELHIERWCGDVQSLCVCLFLSVLSKSMYKIRRWSGRWRKERNRARVGVEWNLVL